jgi:hypothetical protein
MPVRGEHELPTFPAVQSATRTPCRAGDEYVLAGEVEELRRWHFRRRVHGGGEVRARRESDAIALARGRGIYEREHARLVEDMGGGRRRRNRAGLPIMFPISIEER